MLLPSPVLRALLDQILEEPADNALRLVFADALEQSGDLAWAQLVRDQIAGIDTTHLEHEHGKRIAGPIAIHAARWTFERGFVATIAADVTALATHVDTLLGTMPIRSIDVLHPEGGFAHSREADAWMTAFLASPHLTGLETLRIEAGWKPVIARAIAKAHPRLPRLRALRFHYYSGGELGDDGARAIAESPLCAQLEELQVIAGGISAVGVIALAPSFRDLRVLSLPSVWLVRNPIGTDGAVALASAPGLAKLEELDLAGAGIGSIGARAFVEATWIANVRALDLADNGLTDDDVLAIAEAAPALTTLCVDSGVIGSDAPPNRITAATIEALKWRGIEILSDNDDDDE